MMKLHNTLTRSVDDFSPLTDTVKLYTCGPTVYDFPTIGNWTAYVRWDILARVIRQRYNLEWYMNITDVGHLVSDADDGEDKLEKGAQREGKTAWQVAEFYTSDFIAGLQALNISIEPKHLVKATDHIKQQINLIKTLETKGYTYVIDDGVYFDSTKFADYGKMARLDIAGLQAGARVEIGDKKHISDFALWKLTPKDQKRDMEWESPWGTGFPGWHIECSAMAMEYLGHTLDIHTGGIDHIPIHHTNEIAQSEAATGEQFSRFWLHSNFLQVDGSKISKSLGNGYTLQDLAAKGYSGTDFRMFVLHSQYQTEANFTWEGLEAARVRLRDLQAIADLRFQLSGVEDHNVQIQQAKTEVLTALDNNLNTPQVLAILSGLTGLESSSKDTTDFNDLLTTLDEVLGLKLLYSTDITDTQKELIAQRQSARDSKDWSQADALRDQLLADTISVRDTANGSIWRRN